MLANMTHSIPAFFHIPDTALFFIVSLCLSRRYSLCHKLQSPAPLGLNPMHQPTRLTPLINKKMNLFAFGYKLMNHIPIT